MSISRRASRPCSGITVVVVDDDASFRSGVAANLDDDGHVVHEYEDPREVPADSLETADVVVSDYQMAEVDGITFADDVHARRPDLSVVLATAYWTVEIEAEVAARRGFVRLCRKPVDYDELHLLVHELAAAR
jgi:two-component system response regulator AtoC